MANREELPEAELDEWYALAGDRDGERNIGTVAHDRKIRRLIEELRRARARECTHDRRDEGGG